MMTAARRHTQRCWPLTTDCAYALPMTVAAKPAKAPFKPAKSVGGGKGAWSWRWRGRRIVRHAQRIGWQQQWR